MEKKDYSSRERMAQRMPANFSQPGPSARPSQRVSARFIGKAFASFVAEDEVALQMAMSFEETNGFLAQSNLPRSTIFGRANLPPPIGAPSPA